MTIEDANQYVDRQNFCHPLVTLGDSPKLNDVFLIVS